MTIPNLLVSRSRRRSTVPGLNNFRVFNLVGGSELRQIGSSVTSVLESPNDSNHTRACTNRIVEFRGERYAYHRFQILAENTGGTGNWGQVATLSGTQISTEDHARHSGLYKVQVNGVNTLVAIFHNVSSQIGAIKSTDGTTWTLVNPINGGIDGNLQIGRSIVFRNQLYTYVDMTPGAVIRYDPQTDTGTFISVPAAGNPAHDFCVLNNKLYLVGTSSGTASTPTRLYELRGNAFESINTFTEVQNEGNNERSCPVLFTDNTDLIAIIPGEDLTRTGPGDVALRIQNPGTGSQTITDITTSILPGYLIAPSGTQASAVGHWNCFVNNDSDPANPEIYLFRTNSLLSTDTAQTVAAYEYINTSTPLNFLGNGIDYEIALPHIKFGGSERIYGGSNKVYAELEGLTEVTGGIQFFYRVYGTGADKTGTLYINNGEQIPTTVATLTGAATGGSSVRSGNTITTITPDSGATLYSGIWAAGTDGFSETDNLHLQFNLT